MRASFVNQIALFNFSAKNGARPKHSDNTPIFRTEIPKVQRAMEGASEEMKCAKAD